MEKRERSTMALGKSARRADHEVNTFIETGSARREQAKEKKTRDVAEREVTKTFRLPESLGRDLKVHAAQHGLKEKDILIALIQGYLEGEFAIGEYL